MSKDVFRFAIVDDSRSDVSQTLLNRPAIARDAACSSGCLDPVPALGYRSPFARSNARRTCARSSRLSAATKVSSQRSLHLSSIGMTGLSDHAWLHWRGMFVADHPTLATQLVTSRVERPRQDGSNAQADDGPRRYQVRKYRRHELRRPRLRELPRNHPAPRSPSHFCRTRIGVGVDIQRAGDDVHGGQDSRGSKICRGAASGRVERERNPCWLYEADEIGPSRSIASFVLPSCEKARLGRPSVSDGCADQTMRHSRKRARLTTPDYSPSPCPHPDTRCSPSP